jgi:gliding motility-associated-like protein
MINLVFRSKFKPVRASSIVFLALFWFALPIVGLAQVDTEFWFAPPEVSSGHGDRPIFLRISTLNQSGNVRVLLPANNLVLANVNVPANTTTTLDLSSNIMFLEPSAPATVLKTGLRIISTVPVTAYYEVGAPFNADIFALKGKNALGNSFVIPAQNLYDNGNYTPTPYFSFDIVATQNNTVVKVKPTKPLLGHQTAAEITVKLNAGETYSFRKMGTSAQSNPWGTVVQSNKPIAITLKDDSVINGGCRDLIGDQMVPIEVTGSEYVVVKGFLASTEYLFITAITNNTKVFVRGSNAPTAILQAGGIHRLPVTDKAMYVLSSNPVYAIHVTGFGCEMGMAILPSINCKGSTQIGFTRATSEFFGLNLLVRKEGISNFTLNGSSAHIPSSAFSAVPETGDKWYAAQLGLNEGQVPVNLASLISNPLYSFQVGIINGNAASSCRYGYFSAFSTLFIGDDFSMCEGETVSLDAGTGKEKYLWSTGATDMKIDVTQPGKYWVRTEKENCVLIDTITIQVKKGNLNLGPDVTVCVGDTAKINGQENFSWLWSDGSKSQILRTSKPGKYWVSVFDYTGCQASDTILVSQKPRPLLSLGPDRTKCPLENVVVTASSPGATFQWHDGGTGASRTFRNAGVYWCRATVNGCSTIDSITVKNFPSPTQDSIFGSPSVCPFVHEVDYRVDESYKTTYQWFVKGGTISQNRGPSIKINWGAANAQANVKAVLTDAQGCKSDTLLFRVRINPTLDVEIPDGPDELCLNKSKNVLYSTGFTNGSVYKWNILGGKITQGQGTANVAVDWNLGFNKLWVDETSVTLDTVCAGTSKELLVEVFKDEAGIAMNSVSVDTVDENKIHVHLAVQHPETIKDKKIFLHKKSMAQSGWQLVAELKTGVTAFADVGNSTGENSYSYYASLTNLCDERLASATHTSILLKGVEIENKNAILLTWNRYRGWAEKSGYEIWAKIADDAGFRKLASVDDTTQLVSTLTGFDHRYRIRAVDQATGRDSWSNSVSFSFEHDITVPNIFTPNGDAHNQFFEIINIEVYEESHLLIMNRWGETVFETRGYQNDWDGGNLSTGTYYYVLARGRGREVLKGSVTIVR